MESASAPAAPPAQRPPLSIQLARRLWDEVAPSLRERPRVTEPVLVLLGGVPLSGKSTLARALAQRVHAALCVVENDRLRAEVAQALGTGGPVFSGTENRITYLTAWGLVDLALAEGVSVLHDATNLDESARRGAYAVADTRGARVVVVLLETPESVREARFHEAPATQQEAFRKLGRRRPNPASVKRPVLVLDGARPVEENVARLAQHPLLAPLFGGDAGPQGRGLEARGGAEDDGDKGEAHGGARLIKANRPAEGRADSADAAK